MSDKTTTEDITLIAQAYGTAIVSVLSNDTYHYSLRIPTKDKNGLFISRRCTSPVLEIVTQRVLDAENCTVNESIIGMNKLDCEVLSKLSFGEAFEAVKNGAGMRLPSWSPEVIIRVQYPDECSKMTAPYLYVESRKGKVPWKETMIELFSEEWEVVE